MQENRLKSTMRIVVGCVFIIVGALVAADGLVSLPYPPGGWEGVVVSTAAGFLGIIIGTYALTRKSGFRGKPERDALSILVGWAFIVVGIVFLACALTSYLHGGPDRWKPVALLGGVGVMAIVIGIHHAVTRKAL